MKGIRVACVVAVILALALPPYYALLNRFWFGVYFTSLTGTACEAEMPPPYGFHDFPDGSTGWTANLAITPERFPCSARFSLADGLHSHWYCVAVRGKDAVWSIDRPMNARDMQRYTEVELVEGTPGKTYRALVFFHRRGNHAGNSSPDGAGNRSPKRSRH